jgi:signal peptidase I
MRFSEILLIATAITGLICLMDVLFFKRRRAMNAISSGALRSINAIKEPWYVEYSKSFFPVLLIVLILRSFLAEPFRIPSASMHPTLWEGDFILVNKYNYGIRLPGSGTKLFSVGKPKRGDVIVFKHDTDIDSKDMIKRVVGLPGDHVEYKDKVIYINGEPVKQTFNKEAMDHTLQGPAWTVRELEEQLGDNKHSIFVRSDLSDTPDFRYKDVIVPKDNYFVMGDNRDNSGDSRVWGFVKDEEVLGRAFSVWMSWDSLEPAWLNKIRWNRIATWIQ